jgi:hypothetical protein
MSLAGLYFFPEFGSWRVGRTILNAARRMVAVIFASSYSAKEIRGFYEDGVTPKRSLTATYEFKKTLMQTTG